MITDSQVGIQRPSGLRRSEQRASPRLIGILTDHPVAKILALLFAMVLIALIDRELETTLLDAEFDVRVGEAAQATASSPGRRQIVLDTEPGVAVRFFKPLQVRVVVKGQQKLADQFRTKNLVGSVLIKASWLKADAQGTKLSISRTIEGSDVQIAGARGVVITLDPPIQIDLDPESVQEVTLKAAPQDVPAGLVAEVVFEPPKIRVLGPESLFQGSGAVREITVPIRAKRTDEPVPVASLPEEYLQRQIRMAPDQHVIARVRFAKADVEARLDVTDVPIRFVRNQENLYSFAMIGVPKNSVSIEFSGTREAVSYWKDHIDELRRRIRAEIDTEKLVSKSNPQPGVSMSEYADIEIVRIPENLNLVAVTPAQVDVSVKKSP